MCSVGGRGQDHWNASQVTLPKARRKQQAGAPGRSGGTQPSDEPCGLTGFQARPAAQCPLAGGQRAGCRDASQDGGPGRGSRLAVCIFLSLDIFSYDR